MMQAGTLVLNQDPTSPLVGVVLPESETEYRLDGHVWVAWCHGLVCAEYERDVTPIGSGRRLSADLARIFTAAVE